MAFEIVHVVPMCKVVGKERIELDPKRVGRMEVLVDFDGVLETRHTHYDRGKKLWQARNSSRVLRERQGILATHESHKSAAASAQERVSKIGSEIAELKNKRSVTEKRKLLKDALKLAKATLAVANSDLAKVAMVAKRVDETHPEIVAFV